MPARREPTLADVAERAGVSLTTVSRVLNNRGYLSQYTRDRVGRPRGPRPTRVAALAPSARWSGPGAAAKACGGVGAPATVRRGRGGWGVPPGAVPQVGRT